MAKVAYLRYDLTRPGQKTETNRSAKIEGEPQPKDYAELEYLLTHPWGEGATVTNVRAVDVKGNPLAEPPAFTVKETTPAIETPAVVEP